MTKLKKGEKGEVYKHACMHACSAGVVNFFCGVLSNIAVVGTWSNEEAYSPLGPLKKKEKKDKNQNHGIESKWNTESTLNSYSQMVTTYYLQGQRKGESNVHVVKYYSTTWV